jgi:hypothetical protein
VSAMITTSHIHPLRIVAGGAGAALLCALALSPSTGHAAARTQTLRIFSKEVSFTFTRADGTVSHRPPMSAPKAGDVLEIDSLDYVGNHRHHAKRWTISDHLHCVFQANAQPVCDGEAAVGGSLLLFHASRLVGGTGRYEGATGNVVSHDVTGGTDSVVKIHLH